MDPPPRMCNEDNYQATTSYSANVRNGSSTSLPYPPSWFTNTINSY